MPMSSASSDHAAAMIEHLKLVANLNRLQILYLLARGEHSVGQIEAELGIRQPSLSQQLGELREAGVVQTRREHKTVFYTLSDPLTLNLLHALDVVYSGLPGIGARQGLMGPRTRTLTAAMFAKVGDGR